MKILYILSGIDKENGFNKELSKYFNKDINNNMSICFIASSFDNYNKTDENKNKIINNFSKISINFKNVYLIDNRVTKSMAKEMILKSDIVFLMGGSPVDEMNSIKEYGLNKLLKKREGITMGVSAGAMNMTKDVIYIDEERQERLINYKGLGFIDMTIYPHVEINDFDILRETFEVSKHKKIYALPNDSFIRCVDGDINFINNYYIVSNGILYFNNKQFFIDKINELKKLR